MKNILPLLALLLAAGSVAFADSDEFLDQLEDSLAYSSSDHTVRAKLSGTVDLEEYQYDLPAPALIYSSKSHLFNPRLTLYLDTQIGTALYGFVQFRADHGFDPSDGKADARLDEYALRFTPGDDGRFQFQIGKFSAVVGNWIRRHGSWDNPFISAPLPYESLTGVWDIEAAPDARTLLMWAHVWHNPTIPDEYTDKDFRLPIIWGPSYAPGVSVASKLGPFELSAEMKSTSLSARPSEWEPSQADWSHPTFNGEISFRPNPTWNIGVFASSGIYLRPGAFGLGSEYHRDDYREVVFGQDFEYAWHHLQVWAEIFEAKFQDPYIGDLNVTAYYVEAKYQFTPQFFGAVRWNQETFGEILVPGTGYRKWGRDTYRIDVAPTYRFTRHTQLKFEYSFQHGYSEHRRTGHTLSVQFTLRF